MWKRIDYWKDKWYSEFQIQSHLDYEKRKRDIRKSVENDIKILHKKDILDIKEYIRNTEWKFRNVTTDWRWFYLTKPYKSSYSVRKTENIYFPWDGYMYMYNLL